MSGSTDPRWLCTCDRGFAARHSARKQPHKTALPFCIRIPKEYGSHRSRPCVVRIRPHFAIVTHRRQRRLIVSSFVSVIAEKSAKGTEEASEAKLSFYTRGLGARCEALTVATSAARFLFRRGISCVYLFRRGISCVRGFCSVAASAACICSVAASAA